MEKVVQTVEKKAPAESQMMKKVGQSASNSKNVPTSFKHVYKALTSKGDTPQKIEDIAPRIKNLLGASPQKSSNGTSIFLKSADGKFAIRITHNQVGANSTGELGSRIHLYKGTVSGHGDHLVLEAGTTLDNILAALGL